ncbi:GntR family transcriptional regulator [Streptomyces sp. NBC_01618]|uniref:GntR family transcriptional regulator n=1 Tax=Streptomyces sp. NBC_01618 TaxID=2975900 RepID=UPI00386BE9B0|nr:winged helix-turn-helix domain-containing protein [Streptomyces sp. NBC_01618]
MELSPDDPRPAYLQIAAALRADIVAERLGPGSRLPSGRTLAKEFGAALMTVQHALRVLSDEGLVVSQQGRGVFVAVSGDSQSGAMDTPNSPDSLRRQLEAIQVELRKVNERLATIETRLNDHA